MISLSIAYKQNMGMQADDVTNARKAFVNEAACGSQDTSKKEI